MKETGALIARSEMDSRNCFPPLRQTVRNDLDQVRESFFAVLALTSMCRQTTCERCGKITWAGCGQHVEAVMANVPDTRRCQCPREAPKPGLLESVLKALGGGK